MNKPTKILMLGILLSGCATQLHEPLPETGRRAAPLSFGLYVAPDPAQNPIDPPERFFGYHAATDYEVTASELETDVPVYAICSGSILFSGFVEGYGGAIVHTCQLQGEPVTVVYGHLLISSLPQSGDRVRSGQQIALLAPARSHDSDKNRKHLHLGIHRGKELSYLGYVQDEADLVNFLDPADIVPSGPLSNALPTLDPYWTVE